MQIIKEIKLESKQENNLKKSFVINIFNMLYKQNLISEKEFKELSKKTNRIFLFNEVK